MLDKYEPPENVLVEYDQAGDMLVKYELSEDVLITAERRIFVQLKGLFYNGFTVGIHLGFINNIAVAIY